MPGRSSRRVAAHSAIAGRPVRGLSQREHENALAELLTEEPMLLFIDEAQNAPLEMLRNLLEAPGAQFAVALLAPACGPTSPASRCCTFGAGSPRASSRCSRRTR